MIGHFNTVFLSEGKAKEAKPVIHKAVAVNLSAQLNPQLNIWTRHLRENKMIVLCDYCYVATNICTIL